MHSATKRAYYSITATCFLIQAIGIGTFVSYGVFFNALIDEFNWSRALISGASSLALFLSGLLAIIVGRLNDLHGPKNLMSVASLFFGAGLMLLSRINEAWQLYLFYGIVFGLGLSAIDVIALSTTARWFPHARGMMTGIVKVGTGAGQFLMTFLAGILLAALGWRQANMVLGLLSLSVLFLLSRTLKRDPGEFPQTGIDLPPLPAGDTRPTPSSDSGVGGALRTRQMGLLCGVNFLLVFTMMIIIVHIVPHARDLGLSAIQSVWVLSTIGAVSMIGRLACGLTIDRVGSRAVMIGCYALLIGSLLWLQIASSPWMLYLFACIYGLAHGGFYTAISPIVVEIFGIAAHGALFGIVLFAGTSGGAAGPVVAGLMFDVLGSYTGIFWIITLMSCVGLLSAWFLKPKTSGGPVRLKPANS